MKGVRAICTDSRQKERKIGVLRSPKAQYMHEAKTNGREMAERLARERPVKWRKSVFAHVRGGPVSEKQWLSQGAVIQAGPSCRLARVHYKNILHV